MILNNEQIYRAQNVFKCSIKNPKTREWFQFYIDTLQITFEQAKYIVTHNMTAVMYLDLVYGSKIEWTKYLIKITLFRNFEDDNILGPIKDIEKELIKKYYGLEIK